MTDRQNPVTKLQDDLGFESTADFAKALGVAVGTVYNWRASGVIPTPYMLHIAALQLIKKLQKQVRAEHVAKLDAKQLVAQQNTKIADLRKYNAKLTAKNAVYIEQNELLENRIAELEGELKATIDGNIVRVAEEI